jgi:UTP--glucose-1-phosphate uridylyltransferase
MKKYEIRTAIIPVAGLGTRFLPATKAQPKEMLPVVDKPMIQYIVEEAVDAGIKQIVFVTSIGKRAIEDHFDRNFELEYRLEQQHRIKELRTVSAVGKLAKFAFVRQAKPLGDGDAVLAALPFVKNEAFAVLFGDDVMESDTPAIKQLMDVYTEYHAPVMAVGRIPKKEVSKYGVIGSEKVKEHVHRVNAFIEKPSPAKAPSNLCVIGRYILTPEVMRLIGKQKADPAKGKEIRIVDALTMRIKNKEAVYARELTGTWHECGNKLGLMKASIAFGLKHPEIKAGLRAHLKKVCR